MTKQELIKKTTWRDRVYWHWQNLNEDSRGRIKGSGFWHGRAWLYFWHNRLHAEWLFGKHSTHAGMSFDVGGEDSFGLGIRIPLLFSIYLTAYINRLRRSLPDDERTTGWWAMDGSVWLELLHADGWPEKKGWQKVLHLKDWLRGKPRRTEETLSEHEAIVQLPDGDYPVTVRLFKTIWRYPRWWPDEWVRADVTMLKPIPARGFVAEEMGLDEDAVYSSVFPATSLAEALELVKTDVLRDRARG